MFNRLTDDVRIAQRLLQEAEGKDFWTQRSLARAATRFLNRAAGYTIGGAALQAVPGREGL